MRDDSLMVAERPKESPPQRPRVRRVKLRNSNFPTQRPSTSCSGQALRGERYKNLLLQSSGVVMMRDKSITRKLLLALVVFLVAAGAQGAQQTPKATKPAAKPPVKKAAPAVKPVLEPKAIDILRARSDRLAAARSMSFTAVISYESPSRLGPPLIYTTKSEVTLQRPARLRVITAADGPAHEFYYDGKTMVAFSPAENLVAIAD